MQIQVKNTHFDFQDPIKKARTEKAIRDAVARSFIKYPMRRMTRAEVVRRFNICFEGFRVMRNELKYGFVKSLDHLDKILDEALADIKFKRTTGRAGWFGRAGV